MAYQVLARKWRPQDFSSVVGQQPIVTALRNGITEGRVAQAYLFSGIRGVGKTSVARILAKALNCERGPAEEPCNECVTCREVTQGSDLDVLEVDAATYSKVEQVRELTESLKYGPARDRYKVVVVDEIHRLSRQAFDALLKIVEEPPPHLVFIFATTEIEAVPATILSRCQEFRFHRVPSHALARHLAQIAESEEIEVSEPALRLIARAGDGSVRDAVALLDQLATFGSGAISDEEAARVLGGVDHAVFRRLLTAIHEGDSTEVARIIEEIEEAGWDPRHVYTEFLGYCRNALHLALGVEDVDLPKEEADHLGELAREVGYENLLRLLHLLLNGEAAVRHSETGTLALEIAWLRAAELPKLIGVEEILGRLGGGGGSRRPDRDSPPARGRASQKKPAAGPPNPTARTAPSASPPPDPEPGPPAKTPAAPKSPPPPPEPPAEKESAPRAPTEEAQTPAAPNEKAEPTPTAERPPAAAARESAPDAGESDPAAAAGQDRPESEDRVERFLEHLSRRRQVLAAHLREAVRLNFENGALQIYAPPDDPWLSLERLRRPSNQEPLEEALAEAWGPGAGWRLVASSEAPRKTAPEPEAAPEEPADEVIQDPRVQTVLDIFGGKVESIVDDSPPGDSR